MTAMRARFRAFQHGQQSQDMTGSACRFWRGLCVRAGSMLARRVSQVLWSTPPPGSQARVKPKAQAAGEAGLDLSKEHLRTQELEQRGQLRIPSAFPSSGEGSGGRSTPPLSRHHVGNRACVAARPGKKTPPANPSLVTGISWGCLRVVDGNAGTVSSFPARTTVARHDRFCLQVLAWLVRPCGFDACPSCVSSSLVHAAPWLAGPREAEGASGRRSRPRFI